MKDILTKRCKLIRLCEADKKELTELYTSEDVRKYLGGACSEEKAMDKLRGLMSVPNGYNFVAKLNNTNCTIGLLMIAPYHDSKDMEISYMFLPKYWGKGYAKEAIKALLDFCKSELNLTRVVSETQAANVSSCRLLESLGYMVEKEIDRFGEKQMVYVYEYSEVKI